MKRMQTFVATAAVALLGVAGCGGGGGSTPTGPGGNGSGAVNGTISGVAMKVGGAISGDVTFNGGSGGTAQRVLGIALTNITNTCAAATAGGNIRNLQVLFLQVGVINASTGAVSPPTGPGKYTIVGMGSGMVSGNAAGGGFNTTDASCNQVVQAGAASGSVTLTALSSSGAAGAFDLTFNTGDHVTGSFSSVNCPGLNNAANGGMSDGGAGACH